MERERQPTRLQRPIATTLVAWASMVGVDLLLHAGLLAPLYDWDSPFLLSPEEAFIRIPAGYLGIGVLAGALTWLLPRLGVARARDGAVVAGTGVWGALLLGVWSIASADPGLLLGWWAGQTVQLAVGGALIGAAIAGTPIRRLGWSAVGIVLIGIVAAVVLQSIGYAPAPRIIGSWAVASTSRPSAGGGQQAESRHCET
jgi:hypothetical protein